jgi:hypothetical protein
MHHMHHLPSQSPHLNIVGIQLDIFVQKLYVALSQPEIEG